MLPIPPSMLFVIGFFAIVAIVLIFVSTEIMPIQARIGQQELMIWQQQCQDRPFYIANAEKCIKLQAKSEIDQ